MGYFMYKYDFICYLRVVGYVYFVDVVVFSGGYFFGILCFMVEVKKIYLVCFIN